MTQRVVSVVSVAVCSFVLSSCMGGLNGKYGGPGVEAYDKTLPMEQKRDAGICEKALNGNREWDASNPENKIYIDEAVKRGFTPDRCYRRVNKIYSTPDKALKLESLNEGEVCEPALNPTNGWELRFPFTERYVIEAKRRGFTAKECTKIVEKIKSEKSFAENKRIKSLQIKTSKNSSEKTVPSVAPKTTSKPQSIASAKDIIPSSNDKPSKKAELSPKSKWMTAKNNPDCKIWNPLPKPNESVTWSGKCVDGQLNGMGVKEWSENGKVTQTNMGKYDNGKEVGLHTIEADDYQYVGELVNGLYEGQGTYVSKNGDGFKYVGEFSGGKFHGKGTVQAKNGDQVQVEYSNGKIISARSDRDKAQAIDRANEESKRRRRRSANNDLIKLGLEMMRGGKPSSSGSSRSSPSTIYLKRDYISGTNRICIYAGMTGEVVKTVGAADICPM